MSGYNVAIVGATGAVGARMIKMVEQTSLPVNSVKLLASSRSAGKQLQFNGQALTVEETVPESFEGIDLALFSAGGSVSKKFAPEAVKRGAVVVDNTSAFRMDPKIPLVVPEVNPEALKLHHGIVANPNCSTIQMVVALEPVRKAFGLKRVIVSTYQAVGGAGNWALKELHDETEAYLKGEEMEAHILPVAGDKKHYPIAFNALPQIDVFEEDGYTHEEWKMIHETKKIMCGGDMDSKDIKVTATCVRIPVPVSHSESVYFEVEDPKATVKGIQDALAAAPGVVLQDDPDNQIYPQAHNAEGSKDTFVGRVRPDQETPQAFHMWNVSDNLLKGAAWNSVQIAETMDKMGLLHMQ
ncbi:aspartate-semialdehyde dehydrogenase [Lactiplantibacillus plantarum]|uniref:aspartate-semialdehyde dehydrogenase n=1 Tax=Lactiplantibacillus plantarum TaxID=1590 RepID=UPI000CFA5EEF|nr:aspartate-semialdehyde dehydrogenase [Lactiplantibacillus plantarum]MCW6101169.1 aspartate-semialdehyde dehydrogenase [Lactiplantibacillus plantarum]MCW6104296.1 aspartate-semialdehyde dehydrogenase [Lactiplantibacillus plantarum]SPD93318.1 Aspartate-semialdehyde dehydrogenase [Lactiplantibacillus plantarum]VFI64724.1 Aspartate-semialdehyde dehydrogenase [Lactiplantibacillus plantarum]VFQ57409.1 Aspartate-semialdehyde dehydrogenase [Lactiplantibacillus plantarum]